MPAQRILHVSQPVTEGVAVVLADLAEFQQANGWEVHVACPPGGWLGDRLVGTGITVHAWEASRSPGASSLNEARELMAVVRRLRPDVVHLHSSKAGLAGRLALRGKVATVFQPHSWSFHAVGGVVALLSAGWERAAMRWTDLVVAVSGEELDEGVQRGIDPRRTVVAPNGVDVLRFMPRDRAAARARLGLGPQPLVVCVGRLARQKGQDMLLAAWPDVLTVVPEARLALVGDGPEHDRLASLAEDMPSVQLFGGTGRPEDWYTAADVVVVPSRWEGMALVPLEAMASQRPVVGFDVAGLTESIGEAGAVVRAGDLSGLAQALAERLLDRDLAEREGRLGRLRAVSQYDRHQAVVVTDEAIRTLLQALPRARRASR